MKSNKKNNKIILCILALTMVLVSCESLDLAPEDYYGSSNFWNNEAQVKAFITGHHAQLRGSYVTLWLMGEARGGLRNMEPHRLPRALIIQALLRIRILQLINQV